jgi:hypothetical protein
MDRTEQDTVACVKYFLCSVPVVEIPVNDRYAPDSVKRNCCGNCRVIKKAEPHRAIGFGMVTRRTDKGKTMAPVKSGFYCLNCGTGSVRCDIKGTGGDIGIVVDKMLPPLGREVADHADVGKRMDSEQVAFGRRTRAIHNDVRRYCPDDITESSARFIMGIKVMFKENRSENRPATGHGVLRGILCPCLLE